MTRVFKELLTEDLQLGSGAGTKPNPGGGELTGTKIGIQSFAVGGAKVDKVWDPPEVAAGGQTSTTVTVAGAALGDFVDATFSLALMGLLIWGEVTSANTVTVYLSNLTGEGRDLASGTVSVLVLRSG